MFGMASDIRFPRTFAGFSNFYENFHQTYVYALVVLVIPRNIENSYIMKWHGPFQIRWQETGCSKEQWWLRKLINFASRGFGFVFIIWLSYAEDKVGLFLKTQSSCDESTLVVHYADKRTALSPNDMSHWPVFRYRYNLSVWHDNKPRDSVCTAGIRDILRRYRHPLCHKVYMLCDRRNGAFHVWALPSLVTSTSKQHREIQLLRKTCTAKLNFLRFWVKSTEG